LDAEPLPAGAQHIVNLRLPIARLKAGYQWKTLRSSMGVPSEGPGGKEPAAGKGLRRTILPADFRDGGREIDRFQLLGFLELET
jgi:hypothetical protein